VGFDQVIATGLAKEPGQRYPSTVEMAAAARQAATDPIGAALPPNPDPAYAQPFQADHELATTPAQFTGAPPTKRRRGLLIGALAAVLLLVVGTVVAANVVGEDDSGTAAPSSSSEAPTPAAPPPNTGPFTGMYKVVFGAAGPIGGDGQGTGPKPPAATYSVSSLCRPTGCVATASKSGGDDTFAPAVEFDELGDSWVAVTLGTGECRGVQSETFQVFRLQPKPDGTLTGDFTVTSSNLCGSKHPVTFTRTEDVDLESLPDPATLPPRVVSPAEALRGSYTVLRTFANGAQQKSDLAVRTDCLRTGDRCMSYFHGAGGLAQPLVFGDNSWHLRTEETSTGVCPGGAMQVTKTGQYPLPQPPQNPLPQLTGHGTQQQSAPCAINIEFDETFTRTGD